MIRYATATSTRRNRIELLRHGWRQLVSPVAAWHYQPGVPYCLDNGAWSARDDPGSWDAAAFADLVDRLGGGADFVIAPDIVCGGPASLDLSIRWLPWLLTRCRRVLIAVQDGMAPDDVASLRGPCVGVAIGGSTEWKVEQLTDRRWAGPGWLHVLRANTQSRIQAAKLAGADSFDGSSPSIWSVNAAPLANYSRQEVLPWGS